MPGRGQKQGKYFLRLDWLNRMSIIQQLLLTIHLLSNSNQLIVKPSFTTKQSVNRARSLVES